MIKTFFNHCSDLSSLLPHQTGSLVASAVTLRRAPGAISSAQFTNCEDTSGI